MGITVGDEGKRKVFRMIYGRFGFRGMVVLLRGEE